MRYQPPRRPPYFDWRLDRWKIGLALLLWLGLIVFLPQEPTRHNPQNVSPIARPGQRPLVGASTEYGPTDSGQSTDLILPPRNEPTAGKDNQEIESQVERVQQPLLFPPPSFTILESGQAPLTNSTPLFYGEGKANRWVEIRLDGRRYIVLADSSGYWHFKSSVPLPVGMSWVQARQIEADGTPLSETASEIALIAPDAQPIAAPGILTTLAADTSLKNSTPLLTGIGPPGVELTFYAQTDSEEKEYAIGKVTVSEIGTWRWQMSVPLATGETTLWAAVTNRAGLPVSRSWPITLIVAPDAAPSVSAEAPMADMHTTR